MLLLFILVVIISLPEWLLFFSEKRIFLRFSNIFPNDFDNARRTVLIKLRFYLGHDIFFSTSVIFFRLLLNKKYSHTHSYTWNALIINRAIQTLFEGSNKYNCNKIKQRNKSKNFTKSQFSLEKTFHDCFFFFFISGKCILEKFAVVWSLATRGTTPIFVFWNYLAYDKFDIQNIYSKCSWSLKRLLNVLVKKHISVHKSLGRFSWALVEKSFYHKYFSTRKFFLVYLEKFPLQRKM